MLENMKDKAAGEISGVRAALQQTIYKKLRLIKKS
jgi:hypothetical protein